jgi:hypothetical protein
MMTAARRFPNLLVRLTEVGPRGWVLLVRAQAALLGAHVDMRSRPRGELVSAANREGVTDQPRPRSGTRLDEARRVAAAVRRVARYGLFRPSCLVRSVAICRLLRAAGISGGRIRVGVAMRETGFVAHAWVEYDGAVIGDEDSVIERYGMLDNLQVVVDD